MFERREGRNEVMALPKVLIVRHGPRRGRVPRYFQDCLDYLARNRREVHRRLAFCVTGEPAPSLDAVGAVAFWLADPLREMYPACYADASAIAAEARERGVRLINPPEALSNSIKTRQSRLWRQAGLPTPLALPFATVSELQKLLAKLKPPLIVRPDRLHTQKGIHLCRTAEEALRAAKRLLPLPSLVVQLFDVRRSWALKDPHSVYARLFHKKRSFVLGSSVKAGHVFFAPTPIVATQTCTFFPPRRSKMGLPARPKPNTWDWQCVAEDNAFGNGVAEAPELMLRAAKALGLDYLALDYATSADGRIALWEANPYFFLPPLTHSMLPMERESERRYAAIYEAVGDFLLALVEGVEV